VKSVFLRIVWLLRVRSARKRERSAQRLLESLFFDGLDCLPCNLTLNFIGEAVRLSKLSSLGMGFLARVSRHVARFGKS
jgi:hypothetical protein